MQLQVEYVVNAICCTFHVSSVDTQIGVHEYGVREAILKNVELFIEKKKVDNEVKTHYVLVCYPLNSCYTVVQILYMCMRFVLLQIVHS